MIQCLKLDWHNCYGIKCLNHEFDFSEGNHIHLVYAPNGTMKTSFAKTMKYLSGQDKTKPHDQLHENEIAKYSIIIDKEQVQKDNLFVINGDDDIDSSASFVNFLASTELKNKYDEIYKKLMKEKDALMSKLKSCSESTDCEKEIIGTFAQDNNDSIFSILERLNSKVKDGLQLFKFKYNDVFDKNGAVADFILKNKDDLQDYITNYGNLLETSKFYRSVDGHTFGTYQANQLLDNVSDGNYFGVKHKMILQDGTEINTHEELQQIMANEQDKVINDEGLRKKFKKITDAIHKNKELRGFEFVIEQHPEWIPELVDYEEFRKKVWLGYLANNEIKPLFDSYIQVYNDNKHELFSVLSQASKQQEKWKGIIALYNKRFDVPFTIEIENQIDIILKQKAAKLQFIYKEENSQILDKKKLFEILSRGEKRAFIILQFLFEVESRKTVDHDTVYVMDDIADSFDYQNKYAIIEYIKDIAESRSNKFYLIILTHNFDFYRTVSSRLNINQAHLWMVERARNGEIELKKGQYKGNVFINVFVGHDDDDKKFICMIPFVRNLIEYTKGDNSPEYNLLTSCLHIKTETKDITEEQILDIIKDYTKGKGVKRIKTSNKIYNLIISTADNIVKEDNPNSILIENKIVLSIAIRLLAEQYMYNKILLATGNDRECLKTNKCQTGIWTDIYKKSCPNDDNKGIIECVNMITPELIHLNSFMYEPLIDMSIYQLMVLYKDCKQKLILA
jgi:hypothetical protein